MNRYSAIFAVLLTLVFTSFAKAQNSTNPHQMVQQEQQTQQIIQNLESSKHEFQKNYSNLFTSNSSHRASNFENPIWRRVLLVLTHPGIGYALEKISKTPQSKIFWTTQACVFILFLILRLWRFSRARLWIQRLWTGFWTTYLFAVVSLFAVPFLLFKNDYLYLLKMIHKVWSSGL